MPERLAGFRRRADSVRRVGTGHPAGKQSSAPGVEPLSVGRRPIRGLTHLRTPARFDVDHHDEFTAIFTAVHVANGFIESSCCAVVRVYAKPELNSTASPGCSVKVGHHQTSVALASRAIANRDPDRRRRVAFVPSTQHPVGHRTSAIEKYGVNICPRVVSDAPRILGGECMRSEECAADVREDFSQRAPIVGANNAKLHLWLQRIDRLAGERMVRVPNPTRSHARTVATDLVVDTSIIDHSRRVSGCSSGDRP